MAENDLQKRLERLGAQLVNDIEAWEQRTRGERGKALDQLSQSVGGALGEVLHTVAAEVEKRKTREAQKRLAREARKRARHQPSVAVGVVLFVIAAACLGLALLRPELFWMVFVALALGLGGASEVADAARERRARAAEAPRQAPAKPAAPHEVDALCDQLLADLAASPDAVKAFVTEPEKAVASMRATLKSLDVRRRQLLAEDADGRLAELITRAAELEARLAAASSPEARRHLEEARASLAGQREALEHLRRTAERVDGEYTSLLVHLQELRTRVAVARSTGTEVQLEGLRGSVRRLNEELGAISEAMEAVRHQHLSPVAPLEAEGAQPGQRGRVKD